MMAEQQQSQTNKTFSPTHHSEATLASPSLFRLMGKSEVLALTKLQNSTLYFFITNRKFLPRIKPDSSGSQSAFWIASEVLHLIDNAIISQNSAEIA